MVGELIIRNYIQDQRLFFYKFNFLQVYHYNVVLQCQECRCLDPSGRNLVKGLGRPGPVRLAASLGGPVEGELSESPRESAVPKQKV